MAQVQMAPYRSGACERFVRKTQLPVKNLQKRWCGVYKDEPTRPQNNVPGISTYDQDYGYCNGIPHNTWAAAFQQCRAKRNWDEFPPFRTAEGPLSTVSKRPLDMRYSQSEYEAKYRDPRKPPVWRHHMCEQFHDRFQDSNRLLFQMPHEIECNKFLPKGPRELTEDEKQREFKRKHGYLSEMDEAFDRVFPCMVDPSSKPAGGYERRWPATCESGADKLAEYRQPCCRVQLNDKCAQTKTPDFAKNILGMNWVLRTTQTGATTNEDYGAIRPFHRQGLDPNPCVEGRPHSRGRK